MTFQDFISQGELHYNSYQEEGVKWCTDKERNNDNEYSNIKGGIIADEMGLGKTITMLGTMYVNPLPYTLIVVPVALIEQWRKVITQYLNIEPIIYHGQNKSPLKIEESLSQNKLILITTYGVLSQRKIRKKDIKLKPRFLQHSDYLNVILYNIKWSRIIYDEAHNTRNHCTQKFWSCNNLDGSIKWLITGTPMQNKLKDFTNLCLLLNIPKLKLKKNSNLENIVQTYMLRRRKEDVGIHLPPVQINNTIVNWKSDVEKKLNQKFMHYQMQRRGQHDEYDDDNDIEEHVDIDIYNNNENTDSDDELHFRLDEISNPNDCNITFNNKSSNIFNLLENRLLGIPGSSEKMNQHYRQTNLIDDDIDKCAELLENNLLTSMIRGRQICIYPALILPKLKEHVDNNNLSKGIYQLKNYTSKLDAVIEHIIGNQSNNRKIIFCNFQKEIEEVYNRLIDTNIYDKNNIACYNGTLNLEKRRQIIENNNLKLLIIQIQTACDGLNLQHYNEIYFISPCWNPSLEDQAIGRCHRIGQTKTTFVYKFHMAFDNIQTTNMDDYIELNQMRKRSIIQQVYH